MSTWIYLRCTAHDPPINAEGESGQHLYDLPQLWADLATRPTLDELNDEHSDYFRRHTARFLSQHPHCPLEVWDEYGRQHPTEPPEGEPA